MVQLWKNIKNGLKVVFVVGLLALFITGFVKNFVDFLSGAGHTNNTKRFKIEDESLKVQSCKSCNKPNEQESLFINGVEISDFKSKSINIEKSFKVNNEKVFLVSTEGDIETCSNLYRLLIIQPSSTLIDLSGLGIDFKVCRRELCNGDFCKKRYTRNCDYQRYQLTESFGTCDKISSSYSKQSGELIFAFKDYRFDDPETIEYKFDGKILNRDQRIDSQYGDLMIRKQAQCRAKSSGGISWSYDNCSAYAEELIYQGKSITIPDNNFRSIHLEKRFKLKDNEVYLFLFNPMASSCAGLYRFLNVGKDGYTLSGELGTCSDLITTLKNYRNDRVEISVEMPSMDGKRARYIYDGNKVTEL